MGQRCHGDEELFNQNIPHTEGPTTLVGVLASSMLLFLQHKGIFSKGGYGLISAVIAKERIVGHVVTIELTLKSPLQAL